ncbi:hypothetical protein IAT40_001126 [Kwoniella sp. CBS 6097]
MTSPTTPPHSPPATCLSPSPAPNPTPTPEKVIYPLTDTLLPLIEEIDNFPPFSSPFPTRHPITKGRLIPFHATLSDFQRKLPPMGLIPAEVIPELQGIKGLPLSTLIMKTTDKCRWPNAKGGVNATNEEEIVGSYEGQMDILSPSGRRGHFISSRPKDESPSPSLSLSPTNSCKPQSPSSTPTSEVALVGDQDHLHTAGTPTNVKVLVKTRKNKVDNKATANAKAKAKAKAEAQGGDMKNLTMQKGNKAKATYQAMVLCIFFSDQVNAGGYKARTELMQGLARKWKEEGKFLEATKRWCNEPFPVYCSPHSALWSSKKFARNNQGEANPTESSKSNHKRPFGNVAFEFERPMMQVLGFTPFGTHLTAYEGQGDEMKLWISRRSANRSDWPSKLDSTVAGGMPAGVTPLPNIIIECSEEAGWSEELIRKHARCKGMVSFYKCLKTNFVVPGIEYTYDMELQPGTYDPPRPDYKESDKFMLMPVQQVLTALRNHEFKPLSALVTIDFLIRHGYITPENEANYFEIVRRCHRSTGLAGPGL